jgi:hypothetical protein
MRHVTCSCWSGDVVTFDLPDSLEIRLRARRRPRLFARSITPMCRGSWRFPRRVSGGGGSRIRQAKLEICRVVNPCLRKRHRPQSESCRSAACRRRQNDSSALLLKIATNGRFFRRLKSFYSSDAVIPLAPLWRRQQDAPFICLEHDGTAAARDFSRLGPDDLSIGAAPSVSSSGIGVQT